MHNSIEVKKKWIFGKKYKEFENVEKKVYIQ